MAGMTGQAFDPESILEIAREALGTLTAVRGRMPGHTLSEKAVWQLGQATGYLMRAVDSLGADCARATTMGVPPPADRETHSC